MQRPHPRHFPHRDAAVDGDAWREVEALKKWKDEYLYGGGAQTKSKGLRQRKKTNPAMANGDLMKSVLGGGPSVEY